MSNKSVYLIQGSGTRDVLIRDLLDRIFRQKGGILISILLWTTAVGLYLWLSPPTYEGEIQFLVNNNRAGAVVSSELNNGPVSRDYVDESVVATEMQLLSNRELLRQVVRASNLSDGSSDTMLETALKKIVKDLKVPPAFEANLIKVERAPNPPDESSDAAVEMALKKFMKELKVSPVLKANMIKASYSASDPNQVQTVLSNLADGYLSEHVRAHSSTGAFEVFDKQAMAYADRLKELQDGLTAFHERRDIVVLAQQKDIDLHKLMDLEASLKETAATRVANSQKITTLGTQLNGLKPRITTQARVVPNQYSVERLNTMLAELNNKRTELLVKFQPRDRLVQEVEKQIADTKAALDRSNAIVSTEETTDVNPLRQSLEGELAKAEVTDRETRARETTMQQQIAGYRRELLGLNKATATDDQLLREIKETEDNYFLYSKKREEARIEDAMDRQRIANVALVQPPVLPALPLPKLSVTAIATWALGCLLILGGAFGRGLARNSVYTPWELEGVTGLPVLATVQYQRLPSKTQTLIAASIRELEHE
jgi:uncharacterized protein involved in exopolysaccharide biosynthesis